MNAKTLLFEVAVRLWPMRRGRFRWHQALIRMLRVEPYEQLKVIRVGPYALRLDPADLNDGLYYFDIVGRAYGSLIDSLLTAGETVVDVGANVGHFSSRCAMRVGTTGRVHSLEPSRSMRDRWEATVAEVPDGPIRFHPVALWHRTGQEEFFEATCSGWSSMVRNDTFVVAQAISIDTITLDEFVEREGIGPVRLLKLDIEGAEIEALRGGMRTLASGSIDLIMIEAEPHRLRAFGHTGSEIEAIMSDHDYEKVAFLTDRSLARAENAPALGSALGDYLFARSTIVEATRRRLGW